MIIQFPSVEPIQKQPKTQYWRAYPAVFILHHSSKFVWARLPKSLFATAG